MVRNFLRRYDFSNIPRDRWLADSGGLPQPQLRRLRVRERRLAQYNFMKALMLLPVSVARACINLGTLLREFEALHAGPRRHVRTGRGCVIDRQTWLVNGEHISLGDNVKISVFSTVIAGYEARIHIGNNTIIGPGAMIVAINHGTAPTEVPIRFQDWKEAPVSIGENVWIGGGAIILPGTTIGSGTVIGAGTIVRGTIPPHVIAYTRNGDLVTKERR